MKAKETKMQTTVTHTKLLLAFLLLVTGLAWAERVEVASDVSGYTYYIDPATIRKDGNLRKVWEFHEREQPKQDGEMSRRVRNEYDCKNERRNLLFASTHSAPMAAGETLFRYDGSTQEWGQIPPETVAEEILKLVCAQ
jgi:hypothetical protein